MIFFITGTRKGIGRYLAEYYLEKGNIVLGCSRMESDLQHQNYKHYIADITNQSDVTAVIEDIRKNYEYVDIVINNAGVASMNHFLLTPTESAIKLVNTNFIGTFIICREFARLMRKSQNARIINFTTVAKALNLEGEAVYASSKAAVETLTKTISKELASYKITVNAIGPTPVRTDLVANVPKNKLDKLVEHQAIKRFGSFEDISNVVDFFIKPESNFITGQIIYLGGIS